MDQFLGSTPVSHDSLLLSLFSLSFVAPSSRLHSFARIPLPPLSHLHSLVAILLSVFFGHPWSRARHISWSSYLVPDIFYPPKSKTDDGSSMKVAIKHWRPHTKNQTADKFLPNRREAGATPTGIGVVVRRPAITSQRWIGRTPSL
jgi:hypothetical protein